MRTCKCSCFFFLFNVSSGKCKTSQIIYYYSFPSIFWLKFCPMLKGLLMQRAHTSSSLKSTIVLINWLMAVKNCSPNLIIFLFLIGTYPNHWTRICMTAFMCLAPFFTLSCQLEFRLEKSLSCQGNSLFSLHLDLNT